MAAYFVRSSGWSGARFGGVPAIFCMVMLASSPASADCWLVKAIHYVKDGNEEMKALDSINVRDTAIIQQRFSALVKAPPAPDVPDTTASIRLKENLNDKLTYQFSAKSNQFAVFSEIYYDKGWNVTVDGQPADYVRVDYCLRGMAIPAGDHRIDFRFERRWERRYGPDRPAGGPAGDAASFRRTVLMFTNSRMPNPLSSRP